MSTPKSKYKIRKAARLAGRPMSGRGHEQKPWWAAFPDGPYYQLNSWKDRDERDNNEVQK